VVFIGDPLLKTEACSESFSSVDKAFSIKAAYQFLGI
jgi:hypothetical protein